jgi:tRNA splicing ligase
MVQPSPVSVVYRISGSGYEKGLYRHQESREALTMTEASRQPKDKNYNLITVLYQSSDNVESLKTYIQDAEAEGDQELVEFFNAVLENNLEAAQRAKEMLVPRFQGERE